MSIVPADEQTIDEMRAIWGYERDFSLRNKKFAKSISELGDGAGVGKDGFCLRAHVWNARYDADNANRRGSPARKSDDLRYFYRLMPQQSPSGEEIPLAVVIAAIPENESNPAFVVLCGPVDLANDFSFNKEWKVYKFSGAPELLSALKTAESISAETVEKAIQPLLPQNAVLIPGGFFPTCF